MPKRFVVRDGSGNERFRSAEGITADEAKASAEEEADKLREQQPEEEVTVEEFKP